MKKVTSTQLHMTTIPFDAIGFDLDGTLLDTQRDLAAAVNHALELGGFPTVPESEGEVLIGGGAKLMLKKILDAHGVSEADFRPLYKALLAYYSENNAVHTRPYPGVDDTLKELADRKITMAVVTNKFESFAREILTTLGLANHFVAIIGGDTMGKGADGTYLSKPHPDPVIEAQKRCNAARFVFIGDSTYDVAAARGASVPVIAAAYGYCDKPPHELGADAVIDSFDELLPALTRL